MRYVCPEVQLQGAAHERFVPMYVVMIASECAPVAKVGGLADVVAGLSRELQLRGHAVEIILPKYDVLRADQIWGMQISFENLWVPWDGGSIRCTVWFGFVQGSKCYFIEAHCAQDFYNRGTHYGFWDDPERFAFLSKAALEFMLKSYKRPDVIHTHDWQTALVPVLLTEMYATDGLQHARLCHTMHSFAHQGVCNKHILYAAGLQAPEALVSPDQMGGDFDPHTINLTKGAILYAHQVTTVSPQHAWEVQFTDQGCGLGHTLYQHRDKFTGVLNGLDYAVWNPEIDPHIFQQYTAASFDLKAVNSLALRDRMQLRDDGRPIIAYVGRLDRQKGLHLIRHALQYALANDAQFVLLGSGSEAAINAEFRALQESLIDHPDCHLEIGYDEELSHLIYAAADLLIAPSLFEACGLTQMIALRYGTVPLVRSVGGLKDTVFDWDYAEQPLAQRNGFVFEYPDAPGIESALCRALALWKQQPALFRQLALQGMAYDYSWNQPGQRYLDIYQRAAVPD